jgi:hypothetical protein
VKTPVEGPRDWHGLSIEVFRLFVAVVEGGSEYHF